MKKYYNYQIKKSVLVNELKTIERLNLKNGFSYPNEIHDFYEFVYIISGNIYSSINNTQLKLGENDFVLISPKKKHNYTSLADAEIFIVCFKSKSSIADFITDNVINLRDEEKELINKIILESEKSFKFPFSKKIIAKNNAPFGAQQLTENLIEELLILLIRNGIEKTNIKFVANKNELQKIIVSNIIALLNENIYKNITLDDICKKIYYSKTYLNDVFKKHKKTTIKQYYTSLKIAEAEKLLKNNVSTKEITYLLCFDSPNYFEKVFKKKKGISPKAYRNANN